MEDITTHIIFLLLGNIAGIILIIYRNYKYKRAEKRIAKKSSQINKELELLSMEEKLEIMQIY